MSSASTSVYFGFGSWRRIHLAAATLLLFFFSSIHAQNPASTLPPELAPLAAKYQSDLGAITQARDKALAQARQPYLDALTAAEQRANTESKPDEAKAVSDEKAALISGNNLAAAASPLLPRNLSTPRGNYLREAARLEHEYALHTQQVATEYLRGLTFYETKAKAAGQADLLKQIQAERTKLAALGATGPRAGSGTGRNIVINGDFALKKDSGAPLNWTSGGPGKGATASEQGITFLRVVANARQETWFIENLPRPADAQELQITVRMRSSDFKGQGPCGIVIAQRDGADNLVTRDVPCTLKSISPVWRNMTGVVVLRPETKRIVIRCSMADCSATVDFADLRVDAR